MTLKRVSCKNRVTIFQKKGKNISYNLAENSLKRIKNLDGLEHLQAGEAGAFTEKNFTGFPFDWIWNNTIIGIRFQANSTTSAQQIWILQDFGLEDLGESQVIMYKKSYAAVFFNNFKYSNGSRYAVMVCSACKSSADLVRYNLIVIHYIYIQVY
jgi:hypothetical protein